LLLTVGVLDYIANLYHLYWSLVEFDSVVHFIGGAAFSTSLLWFYFFSGFFNPEKRNFSRFLFVSTVGAMAISVSWEIYELIFNQTTVQIANYPYDTTMDLTMGFLGALAACLYGYMKEHVS